MVAKIRPDEMLTSHYMMALHQVKVVMRKKLAKPWLSLHNVRRCATLILYWALLLFTVSTIVRGPVRRIQEPDTKYLYNIMPIDDYRPSVTICKSFGFKRDRPNYLRDINE